MEASYKLGSVRFAATKHIPGRCLSRSGATHPGKNMTYKNIANSLIAVLLVSLALTNSATADPTEFVGALPVFSISDEDCDVESDEGDAPCVAPSYYLGTACVDDDCRAARGQTSDPPPCPSNGKNDFAGKLPSDLVGQVTHIYGSAECWIHLYDSTFNKLVTCKDASEGCPVTGIARTDSYYWVFS